MAEQLRFQWITQGVRPDGKGGYTSVLASNRYRAIIPAAALVAAGHHVSFVEASKWQVDPDHPDVIILGKLLAGGKDEDFRALSAHVCTTAARAVQAGIPILADFNDDHFEHPLLGQHWRETARIATGCVAGSTPMAAVIKRHSDRPIYTIGDPLGSPPGPARLFQSAGPLSRLLGSLGGNGLRSRLKFAWYGNPVNWRALEHWARQLVPLASKQRFIIWAVTQPLPNIERFVASFNAQHGPDALMELFPWDEQTQWAVVKDSDLVLIPSLTSDSRMAVKTSNRLTDAMNAGRYVIASPLPSYQPYAGFATLTDDPLAAVQQYLADPESHLNRLTEGQVACRKAADSRAIGQAWLDAATGARRAISAPVFARPAQRRTTLRVDAEPSLSAPFIPTHQVVSSRPMIDKTFAELFLSHADRRTSKWAHYLEVYERFFRPMRLSALRILEIGVQNGGSLQLYEQYFPNAERIVGVDVDPQCREVAAGKIHVEIGSQADAQFLASVNATHGPFDIVIDDGSHVFDHQVTSFRLLFPLLRSPGIYLVEDVHTSYFPSFGGGIRLPGTFMEFAKSVLDQVNAPYLNDASLDHELADELSGVSFFDSMVVFEKRRRSQPFALTVGSSGRLPTANYQDLAMLRKKHFPAG